MFVAKDAFKNDICARCGKECKVTIDHFIPKSCRMNVNEDGNYVGLCAECNSDKANKIVTPDWYIYLNDSQKQVLNRYMRYAGGFFRANTDDAEILLYLDNLKR